MEIIKIKYIGSISLIGLMILGFIDWINVYGKVIAIILSIIFLYLTISDNGEYTK